MHLIGTLLALLAANAALASGCLAAVRAIRESYGLAAANTQPSRWSQCLQRAHLGYVRFVRYFGGKEPKNLEENECVDLLKLFLGTDDVPAGEAIQDTLKQYMNKIGHRELQITNKETEAAEQLATKSRFTWYLELLGYLRDEETHWKAVKHHIKRFFGEDMLVNSICLSNEINFEKNAAALGLKELRKRYPHSGLNVFMEIVDAKLHEDSDDGAVPCFLVNYLSGDLLEEMRKIPSFGKLTILQYVTAAIERIEDPARPHKYRLHDKIISAASVDVADAFVDFKAIGSVETLSHRPWRSHKIWPYAVAKAAMLETAWILRDAKELKHVLHLCGISARVGKPKFCELAVIIFVRRVTPLWSPKHALFITDHDLYTEIVRAVSVAINIVYPPLWGYRRVNWELFMLSYRLSIL